jgi:hypothetical protein
MKEYLTYNEIETIVENCANRETALQKKMVKDLLVVKFITDANVPDELTNDMWDGFMADGTIDIAYKTVKNLNVLDEVLAEENNVKDILKDAELALEEFLEDANKVLTKTAKKLPQSTDEWENLADTFKKAVSTNV